MEELKDALDRLSDGDRTFVEGTGKAQLLAQVEEELQQRKVCVCGRGGGGEERERKGRSARLGKEGEVGVAQPKGKEGEVGVAQPNSVCPLAM